jgi:hypothetical protein
MRTATIIGAGAFGGWTAHALHQRGWRVRIIEQHGPANARASSGGETRIIRSGYGDLSLYARWARQALPEWLALEARTGERLFARTGALFIGRHAAWLDATATVLEGEEIPCERMTTRAVTDRFPQLAFGDSAGGVLEPEAGVLFARRAVQALFEGSGLSNRCATSTISCFESSKGLPCMSGMSRKSVLEKPFATAPSSTTGSGRSSAVLSCCCGVVMHAMPSRDLSAWWMIFIVKECCLETSRSNRSTIGPNSFQKR